MCVREIFRRRPTPVHPYSFALGFRIPLKWATRSPLVTILGMHTDSMSCEGLRSILGSALRAAWEFPDVILGASWNCLGGSFGQSGDILVAAWEQPGCILEHPRAIWEPLRATWKLWRAFWDPPCGQLGSFLMLSWELV